MTKETEEQWELSDINSDNDKLSNTDNKSKEHDSDDFNIYIPRAKMKMRTKMMMKPIGKKVDLKGAEKWYQLSERILRMKKKRWEPLEKECKKKKSSTLQSLESIEP